MLLKHQTKLNKSSIYSCFLKYKETAVNVQQLTALSITQNVISTRLFTFVIVATVIIVGARVVDKQLLDMVAHIAVT